MRKIKLLLTALLCSALLCSCAGAPAAPHDLVVTDLAGRTVTLKSGAAKTLGLGGSALRLLCYADLSKKVVGIEKLEGQLTPQKPYTYLNPDLLKLPVVGQGGGGGSTPFPEEIIKAAPDVIFASYDKAAADSLQEKTGIPVICIESSGIFNPKTDESLHLIGKIMGCEKRADEIVDFMASCKADLEKRTKGIAPADKKTVYTGGVGFNGPHGFGGTYAKYPPFTAIGAKNVVDETGGDGALMVELEKVLIWQPQVIFLNPNNMNLVNEEYAKNKTYFDSLAAVKAGEVYSQISYNWYGTNIELAIADAYYAGTVLYPEQFKDVEIVKKTDEISTKMLGGAIYDALANGDGGFGRIIIGG